MGDAKKAAIREKFGDEEDYPIHVIGRHIEITDPMKAYAVDKLKKASRFGVRIIEATIVMDIQKVVHCVDFILNVNNTKVKVSGRTETMYSAIDKAIEHLESKLRRYHKRLSEHHAKGLKEASLLNVNIIEKPVAPLDDINDQIEEENLRHVESNFKAHKVLSKETKPLKQLTQEEAIMKMELSGDPFLLFKAEEDHKLKVMYRRDDDNYGVIEVE